MGGALTLLVSVAMQASQAVAAAESGLQAMHEVLRRLRDASGVELTPGYKVPHAVIVVRPKRWGGFV